MGVLNITPDSFSDGGKLFQGDTVLLDTVRGKALAMIQSGARVLDIGGESSRPGAQQVSPAEEQRRVLPVLEALSDLDVILSVDTYHPETVHAAIDYGAGMINDITGGRDPAVVSAVARSNGAYALMHMQGSPQTMQQAPSYRDVVAEVSAYLRDRFAACVAAGIEANRLLVDPGFGFGKTLEHNLGLLRELPSVRVEGCPILVGLSRKTMIGSMTGQPVDGRLAGSLAGLLLALQNGANLVRVHDVAESADVLKIWQAFSALE
ncbi:MAG: dihydropteroate synthase [Pseudomonadales bacterium]|nr:dihydropteroate synthase [Pseudomonadales bacterium]